MKKLLLMFVLLLMVLSGCAKTEEPAETVLIRVNTDGLGNIAVADGEATPEFDQEYPVQSAYMNTQPGTVYTLAAEAGDGYMFTKWTKDGEDYSSDPQITVTVDADVEYIAVFNMSSGYDGPIITKIEDAKTIGDVLGLPSLGFANTENRFICAFELGGITYRAIAEISKETADALFNLDFADPDYQRKYNEMIAPLEIMRIDNISEQIPSQAECDKNIGRTGEELFNEGWYSSGYNLEEQEFYLNHGFFSYTVKFDGRIENVKEDESVEDLIKGLKVVSITYDGIGDPTNPETELAS